MARAATNEDGRAKSGLENRRQTRRSLQSACLTTCKAERRRSRTMRCTAQTRVQPDSVHNRCAHDRIIGAYVVITVVVITVALP
jgi:hypothetical protein